MEPCWCWTIGLAVTDKFRVRLNGEAKRRAALEVAWERRRETVARKIELAALALFEGRSIDGVTVEDISQAAGISRRSFYRYFDSPGDIIRAVFRRSMNDWATAVRDRPTQEDILASFHAANLEVMGMPEHSQAVRSAFDAVRRSPMTWKRISGPVQGYTTKIYREIIAERLSARGEDVHMAGVIAAAVSAIMIHLAEQGGREGRMAGPDEVNAAITAFRELIGEPAALREGK